MPSDTYWAALRKIHRMRKPVFMGSLWLRARFDVEYLGLALPTAPAGLAAQALMEVDLNYIGATRQDRIIADQVRRRHRRRLEWVARWLERFRWTFEELPAFLAREIPYLANRGGEALRALVAACVLDHNDIATLALSIEGLEASAGACRRFAAGFARSCHLICPTRSSICARSGIPSIVAGGRSPSCSCSPAFLRMARSSASESCDTSAGIAAPSKAGSESFSAKEEAIPGRLCRRGCATCYCVPTSGATRSWSCGPFKP